MHTFAIVHRGPTPAFRDRAPYVTAVVEFPGGARMPTNLIEVEPDPEFIKCGMSVEVSSKNWTIISAPRCFDQLSKPR
ncbi:MAG: hypothetical protein CM1200mP15_22990 [Dehalococcoidia bacterium]|nr:MAG: hypothetical protein CM1200mP15_22990 [Dehalococcoidia bacterium]